jgi:hypothetical protein
MIGGTMDAAKALSNFKKIGSTKNKETGEWEYSDEKRKEQLKHVKHFGLDAGLLLGSMALGGAGVAVAKAVMAGSGVVGTVGAAGSGAIGAFTHGIGGFAAHLGKDIAIQFEALCIVESAFDKISEFLPVEKIEEKKKVRKRVKKVKEKVKETETEEEVKEVIEEPISVTEAQIPEVEEETTEVEEQTPEAYVSPIPDLTEKINTFLGNKQELYSVFENAISREFFEIQCN